MKLVKKYLKEIKQLKTFSIIIFFPVILIVCFILSIYEATHEIED